MKRPYNHAATQLRRNHNAANLACAFFANYLICLGQPLADWQMGLLLLLGGWAVAQWIQWFAYRRQNRVGQVNSWRAILRHMRKERDSEALLDFTLTPFLLIASGIMLTGGFRGLVISLPLASFLFASTYIVQRYPLMTEVSLLK